jgi:hypothetical protein
MKEIVIETVKIKYSIFKIVTEVVRKIEIVASRSKLRKSIEFNLS